MIYKKKHYCAILLHLLSNIFAINHIIIWEITYGNFFLPISVSLCLSSKCQKLSRVQKICSTKIAHSFVYKISEYQIFLAKSNYDLVFYFFFYVYIIFKLEGYGIFAIKYSFFFQLYTYTMETNVHTHKYTNTNVAAKSLVYETRKKPVGWQSGRNENK